ncbi:hypothetical protein KDK77_06735 [bacterium]|nr:hypothetical protein [bacterium]
MNKLNVSILFIFVSTVFLTALPGAQQENEPPKTIPGLKREINYHPGGAIAEIKVTYPDNSVDIYSFNSDGELEKKRAADGSETLYRFTTEDGHKVVFETPSSTKTPVKRVFDGRDRITESVYPDYSETYQYTYTTIGDAQTIVVLKDDGTRQELSPDDKYLSFLKDYAILDQLPIPMQGDIYNREYLYNPARFREKMQMHKQQYHQFNRNR